MSNITITNVDHGSVGMGGNEFEDGNLVLTAGQAGTIAEGTILARDGDDWKPYDPTDDGGLEVANAVMPHAIEGEEGDNAVRAIISGQVKAERLVVYEDDDADVADLDSLRQTSIVPVSVEQLAKLDNQ